MSEKLRDLIKQVKFYFSNDQVQPFVLFLEDFFPNEKIFEFFGFTFLKRLHNDEELKMLRQNRKLFFVSIGFSFFVLLTIFAYFVLNVGKRETFIETIETFGWSQGLSFTMLKSLYLYFWKRDAIKSIYDRLEQNFPHSSRDQLQFGVHKHQKNLKNIYRIFLSCGIYIWMHYSCVALLSFLSHLFGLEIMKVNLPISVYFPWDPYNPWLYPFFYITQISTELVLNLIWVSTDGLFYGLVCVTSIEFDILAQKLKQIDPEKDENAEKKLREIIDIYNELTEIVDEIEDIFSPFLLANALTGMDMLCACIFLLFTPLKAYLIVKFAPALFFFLIQLFFISYYGELLQATSLRVATEAYNSIWYGQNLKFRKMILLIMLRAQKSQVLTGLNFMDIGFPVYYWILQTAHSYYSVLSGLYEP